MKVIINEACRRYKEKSHIESSQLRGFIQDHRFYSRSMDVQKMVRLIEGGMKKNHQVGSRSQHQEKQYQKAQSLEQLSLYLNKDNNKQIFALFDLIASHQKGITYETLSKKLKTDIITISHYCCKLKKLRLINWQHEKQGVIVFPHMDQSQGEEKQIKYSELSLDKNEVAFDMKESFLLRQLGMNQNIWINISSEESVSKGGITNQEIKRKIMKHAENKMVRRTVESMKYFEKNAERQGKVFEFKYKNQTQQIKDEIIRKNQFIEQIEVLDEAVKEWLKMKFPQFQGQSFLLDLINNKFKDYISSVGVKQSKRQCTPLKLNRYIKVLNCLEKEGGMRENELRNVIIKDEKEKDIGTMHKRSLMGILQGLRSLDIIFEEEGYYYPQWAQEGKRLKKKQVPIAKKTKEEYEQFGKKRNHRSEGSQAKRQRKQGNNNKFKKISEKKYALELLIALLTVTLDKSVKRLQRKAFNRIVYVQRKKGLLKFIPQTNVLHLLENHTGLNALKFDYNQTLDSFYMSLDEIVEHQGRKEELVQAQNELLKFLRKNPVKNTNSLRIKYGKNWRSKLQEFAERGMVRIEEEQVRVVQRDGFLI